MAEACVLSSRIAFHSHVFRRPLRVRIPPPALGRTVNAARIPVSFSFPGVWERWARLFAVMAPSGPAHINQSHINQGQGRNR